MFGAWNRSHIGPLSAAAGRTMRRCERACASLASIRRRFGYRRLHILLTREGIVMNHKKLRRLYREERLQVRRRGGRKRAEPGRRCDPQGANQRWSLDFLSDALADGRRFRILAIVDDFTGSAWLCADTSLSGLRVVRELMPSSPRPPAMCLRQRHRADQHGDPALVAEHGSNGITSRPASRSKTLSSRASTDGCAMNC